MKWFFYPLFVITSLMIGLASCSKSDNKNEEQKVEEGDSLRDKSFTPPDGPIWHAAILPDSQIIVAGNLYNTGLRSTVVLARLSKDGKLDPTFNAHKDNWNYSDVKTLSLLNSGKILIGGDFDVNGIRVPFLCFNTDGSLDKSFVAPTGINQPTAAATTPDGKIFIGGAYRESSTSTKQLLIRLDADGKQNWQMDVNNYLFSSISSVIPLADGKLLVTGDFVSIGRYIFRLNADLTVDQTFRFDNILYYSTDPHLSINPKGICHAAVQKDGKIIVMGNFLGYYDNNPSLTKHDADGVLRLNPNGTIDASFQTVVNKPWSYARKVAVLDDDRILVARYATPDEGSEGTIMFTPTGARVPNSSFTDPQSTIYGITKLKDRNNYLLWGSFSTAKQIWRVKF